MYIILAMLYVLGIGAASVGLVGILICAQYANDGDDNYIAVVAVSVLLICVGILFIYGGERIESRLNLINDGIEAGVIKHDASTGELVIVNEEEGK